MNKIYIKQRGYDLGHLQPIVRLMDLDLRAGNKKKDARLEISFSNHCYSRGPEQDEVIPPDELVPDGSKHKPRNRIFCPIRYEQSLFLVARIDALIADNGLVSKSRHLKFFSTTAVTQDDQGNPVVCSYYIFMSASKKQDLGKPKKIDIFVESAYFEKPTVPSPVSQGQPLKLSEILGQVWEGTL